MLIKLLLLVMISGCATMFTNAPRRVIVRSDDPAAKIFLDDRYLGKGSATAKIKPYGNYVLIAKKAGCSSFSHPVSKKVFLGWFLLGNCLLNWCSGILIDLLTGAHIGLDQEHYLVNPSCE